MDYISGQSLYELLLQKRIISEEEASQLMFKVLKAINYMHSNDIVHRDIKPENIIIDEHGDPKIIDFGFSRDTWGGKRQLKTIVGSKIYMAPEILKDDPQGLPNDIWALGVILYLMLTGVYPFHSKNIEQSIINTPVIFEEGKQN